MLPAATPPCTVVGVILAGGRSRRMGSDKTALPINEQSMLARVIERLRPQVRSLVVSVSEVHPAECHGLPTVPDVGPRFGGPLFGILSGLQWVRSNTDAGWVASVPADVPFVPPDLVQWLASGRAAGTEVAVARSLRRPHPIIALWPIALADDLEAWLAEPSQRAAKAWLATRRWSAVDFAGDGGADPFFNVNTPEDLALARAQARRVTATDGSSRCISY